MEMLLADAFGFLFYFFLVVDGAYLKDKKMGTPEDGEYAMSSYRDDDEESEERGENIG